MERLAACSATVTAIRGESVIWCLILFPFLCLNAGESRVNTAFWRQDSGLYHSTQGVLDVWWWIISLNAHFSGGIWQHCYGMTCQWSIIELTVFSSTCLCSITSPPTFLMCLMPCCIVCTKNIETRSTRYPPGTPRSPYINFQHISMQNWCIELHCGCYKMDFGLRKRWLIDEKCFYGVCKDQT